MPKKLLAPLCILLAALLLGGLWYFVSTKEYATWLPTEATITDVDINTHRRGGRSVRYFYRYSVDGAAYSGSDLFTTNTVAHRVGDTVPIWYHPHNTAKSTMSTNVDLHFIGPLFLAIPLMLGAYSVYARAEKRSKLQ